MENSYKTTQSTQRSVPPEFRRLALYCPAFKEIVTEYEAGRFHDWEMALSAAVFALASEIDNAQRKGAV